MGSYTLLYTNIGTSPTMLKIAIVVGSTRPGRRIEPVVKWVHEFASKRGDATYEIVDLKDHPLPLLDEPVPPSQRKYSKDHTKEWSKVVAGYDAYIFVTPEYNHSISGALKNALDFVYHEWTNKAAGFVSYGTTGGVRAVEHLRGICAELQIADVRAHVSLSLYSDWENFTAFKPRDRHDGQLTTLLDQLQAWGGAMKTVREQQQAKTAKAA
jgi:NAD(P)H-dependent FMN reductase